MPSPLPFFLCLFLLLLSPLDVSCSSEDDTMVVTSSGPIKGKHVPAGSGIVTAYLGIPYAEPPLGKLRFQKPVPHQPWNHVLEATSFGSSCYQITSYLLPYSNMWVANKPHSEDCLFLNIWVPHPKPSAPVPILVWIHGGGFLGGAASLDLYNGAFLAATENVIVASMNYRLGLLGFLFIPPEAPGNMGIWDQWMALKWVNENAAVFGGDPARLTIFGHSAGAASVGFHLLSSASQPLFAQAVVQSGAPNAPWAWKDPEVAKKNSLVLGHLLGCTRQNDSSVVSCLQRQRVPLEVFYIADILSSPSPTTDGDFLPDEPEKLLQTRLIQAKPLLIGVTSDEGSAYVLSHVPSARENDGLLTWEQLLSGVRSVLRKPVEEDVVMALALKYSEGGHGPEWYRWALAQLARDYFFVCPVAEAAALMVTAGSPVYAYSFNRYISGSIWQEWMGAAHGVEVPYLFGTLASVLAMNQTSTDVDATLSGRMMHYWAEFARSGHPTGSTSNELQWPLYNATDQNVFCISTEVPQLVQISPVARCDFLASCLLTHKNISHIDCLAPIQDNNGKNGTRT